MWSATDAGRAINPDGVLNQIEGGMAQATSWTLQEAGRWDNGIMTAVDYGAYPIQDFVTTPAMASIVIDQPKLPSLGAGEGSQGPAGAAIANAVFAATGRRVAEIPFTRSACWPHCAPEHRVSAVIGGHGPRTSAMPDCCRNTAVMQSDVMCQFFG